MELNEDNIDIFKKELKKVAQIDSLISETKSLMKPLQNRLKQLKLERKDLEKGICPTMEKNDLKQADVVNVGMFIYKVKQSMLPIKQKQVKEKMISFFQKGPASQISFNSKTGEIKADELFNYIYGKQNRQYVKKEELKSNIV